MAVTAGIDPRVLLLITEAFRHGKAIGAWADGLDALQTADTGAAHPRDDPSVVETRSQLAAHPHTA
ncbi:hypothetical protein [Streptomyces griseus]|uniref:hypothetical protein n=1 Tax=Streptomyces globisporus TaxID=1908 RepID=UPI00099C2875